MLGAGVNYDLPRSPVVYLHRIGRMGRAGESGVAVSFVSPSTAAHFRLIEKRNQLALVREQIPGFEAKARAELLRDSPRAGQGLDPNGGIKGQRKNKKDKLREEAKRGR